MTREVQETVVVQEEVVVVVQEEVSASVALLPDGLAEPDLKRTKLNQEQGGIEQPTEETAKGPEKDNTTTNPPPSYDIRLDNVSRYATYAQIRNFLVSALTGLDPLPKIKKSPDWTFAFLSFATEQDRQQAKGILAGKIMKGSSTPLEVSDAVARRTVDLNNQHEARLKRKAEQATDCRTPEEQLFDQVTPQWRLPYADQLAQKEIDMNLILRKCLARIKVYLEPAKDRTAEKQTEVERDLSWVQAAIEAAGFRPKKAIPCALSPIVASPVTSAYRNKCEFSFGVNLQGERELGFLLGLFREGVHAVISPAGCLHVKPEAVKFCDIMREYIRKSDLDIYDRQTKSGFWRMVVLRTQNTGDVMALVQMNPTGMAADRLEKEKHELTAYITEQRSLGRVTVTTLLLQFWDGTFNGMTDKAPVEVAFGPGHVREELLGLKFQISTNAFFQVNTAATELLYSAIREWCSFSTAASLPAPCSSIAEIDDSSITVVRARPEGPETTSLVSSPSNIVLLDLCCGTGTIGITMASQVKKVIGVEMVQDAITDATYNATTLNGLSNITYLCSKVEDAMNSVLKYHVEPGDEIVAVLDPPRSGVHVNVIQAIRNCEKINRIIYVSCAPEVVAESNWSDLCRPRSNKFKGRPFKMTRAQPFDLFPHTKHCELVAEFIRIPDAAEEGK